MPKRIKAVVALVYVVSWATSNQFQPTPCAGKEPAGIVCAKQVYVRTEKVFKTKQAADEFLKVIEEMKATDARLETRPK